MYRQPQKGFLEQENGTKSKRSYTGPQKPKTASKPTKAALPASKATKSKLSAFAFKKSTVPVEDDDGEDGDDNEEQYDEDGDEGDRNPTISHNSDISMSSRKSNTAETTLPTPVKPNPIGLPTPHRSLAKLNDPPATPIPRLNIRDLLRSAEEDKQFPDTQMEDVSGEQVTWAKATPLAKKGGNKPSKSIDNSSPTYMKTPAPKQVSIYEESPLASSVDPAMQLWKKYGSDADPQRSANPAARLFAPGGLDRSPSNLRRTGTSRVPGSNRLKRRMTTQLEGAADMKSASEDDEGGAGTQEKKVKKSRITNLVDKVKEDLNRKMHAPPSSAPALNSGDNYFSSSPPHRGNVMDTPTVKKARPPPQGPQDDIFDVKATVKSSTTIVQRLGSITNASLLQDDDDEEDYGSDVDVDFDVIDEIIQQSQQASVSRALTQAPPAAKAPLITTPHPITKAHPVTDAYPITKAPPITKEPPAIKAHPLMKAPPAAAVPPPVMFNDNDFDDDFGDDDDLFEGEEFQSLVAQLDSQDQDVNSLKVELQERLKRFEVISIADGEYTVGTSTRSMNQKILKAREVTTNALFKIILRDSWQYATNVYPGLFVHVIGEFDDHNTCIIDNKQNYIVVNPDFLISATTVADTVSCMRKAVLQERVRATGDISKAMTYGNILHAVFQAGLEDNDFSTSNLYSHIDRIIINELESLFLLQEEIEVATEYVRFKVPVIQEWSKTFITQKKPNGKAAIADHNNRGSNPLVAINKLLEVEEHIWSPSYGLKGNIDATVQATIIENKGQGKNFGNSKTLTMPLELKTGKAQSIAHRAQTMLYTLLMSDRYDINVTMGLLYYMEGNEMIRITGIQAELRELILKRNEVASYIASRQTLPDMLGDEYACTRCYAKTSCFVYHKLYEGGTPESSGVPSAFPEITEHLNETHAAFFKHWDTLLTYEEKGSAQFRSELWTMTSEERQAAGRAFSNLIIIPEPSNFTNSAQKINKYRYTFKKSNPPNNWSFQDSQLAEGDPIVISDEKGHIALSIGFITEIRRSQVTIQGDRRLHNTRTRQHNFDEDTNQVFNGIIELRNKSYLTASEQQEEPILYRLDKDEFSSGMANIRNNLIQLMLPSSPSKYRQLIVDLIPPIFKPQPTAYQFPQDLNPDQHRAVEKVMSAKDYALVLGMPGTGKTTTIAQIIRALVAQGKSVLLTSYTHTAVDNILLKLRPLGLNILRLGVRSKIHPMVPTFCSLSDTRHTSFSTLREALSSPQIVATTCLSITHPIFQLRKFDYCLIDEASQITLPICIGPIRMADTFVLVGDHYQLPPLVKNPEAREGGLDISLFKLLSEAHPDAVANLEIQYRMCEDIMTLSNELIYSGRLKCGTREVAERALKLPTPDGLEQLLKDDRCPGTCWIRDLFQEKVKAVFVDTDQVPAREVKVGDRTINPVEAALTAQLIEGFLSSGVPAGEIGVITVYRSQLKTIQQLLSHAKEVEMHTADKFQGRDKEVIVISLVRSNDDGNIGDLLRDWRRINVAFTRARSKLIILGSKKTLGGNELLKGFLDLMEGRGWVYQLPKGAEKCHPGIEEGMKGESPRKTQGRRSPKKIIGKPPGGLRGKVLRDIRNEF